MNADFKKQLQALAHAKMPFGKYKNRYLSDIPETYFVWFKRQGFPQGKLGRQMQAVYEMKINGTEGLLRKTRELFPYSR